MFRILRSFPTVCDIPLSLKCRQFTYWCKACKLNFISMLLEYGIASGPACITSINISLTHSRMRTGLIVLVICYVTLIIFWFAPVHLLVVTTSSLGTIFLWYPWYKVSNKECEKMFASRKKEPHDIAHHLQLKVCSGRIKQVLADQLLIDFSINLS